MCKKRTINDYVELYFYAVANGVKKTTINYACSPATVYYTLNIGRDFIKELSVPFQPEAAKEKTLADFKDDDILKEIADRGFKGTLSFTKYVNLEKL